MNKVVNINLSGIILTIEEDAYVELKKYIDALQKHFAHTPGGAEIISDIETRIGELLQNKVTNTTGVVVLADVKEVIDVMGNPTQMNDFDEDFEVKSHSGEEQQQAAAPRKLRRDSDNKFLGGVCSGISNFLNIDAIFIRVLFLIGVLFFGTGVLLYIVLWIAIPKPTPEELAVAHDSTQKRLFRSEDNKMLGGVCSGIANYFGVDQVWPRLLFVVALVLYGSGVLLYFILWAIIPKATTPTQKLQSKGEPIDVNNIERMVKDSFAHVNSNGIVRKTGSMFEQLLGFVWKLVKVGILGVLLLFILFSLAGMVVALVYNSPSVDAFLNVFLLSENVVLYLKIASASMALAIFITLSYMAYRLINGRSIKFRYVALVDMVLIVVAVTFGVLGSVSYASKIKAFEEVTHLTSIKPTSDTLYIDVNAINEKYKNIISISNNEKQKNISFNEFNIEVSDNGNLPFVDVSSCYLKPSINDSIQVVITKSSRAETAVKAEELAERISYEVTYTGNTLKLDKGFLIDTVNGYRYQSVDVVIYVPVGKTVVLNKPAKKLLDNVNKKGNVFKMTDEGVRCLNCEKHHKNEEDDDDNAEDVSININIGSGDEAVFVETEVHQDSANYTVSTKHQKVGPVNISTTKKVKKKTNQ